MAMRIKLLFTLPALLCLSISLRSQEINPALQQKLRGKNTLPEIMKVVDAYYENEGKKERIQKNEAGEDAYNHWKRWEWWMLSHLDSAGGFTNINQRNENAFNADAQRWSGVLKNKYPVTAAPHHETQRTETPDAPFGNWAFLGPTAEGTGVGDIKGLGRMDRIAFHPTNANIIYAGSPSGGLWQTNNGGTTWNMITGSLPALGVSALAISAAAPATIYLLTGDGNSFGSGFAVYNYGSSLPCIGIYKSTDGGVTWTKASNIYNGTGNFVGHQLSVSSTNANYIYAATNQGLYRSTDGALTWQQVRTGNHWDVELKPGNDSTVYTSQGGVVAYSAQGGRGGTFSNATFDFDISSAARIELAVSGNNNNYVYALCSGVPAFGEYKGLFRSVNSGAAFARRSNTPNIFSSSKTGNDIDDQSTYDLALCVKPTDANFVLTGGLCVWRSNGSNGGSSMVYSTVYRESFGTATEYIHPDVHAVLYNPLNGYIYAATDGGIYRSINDGVAWVNLSAGVSTTQFYHFSMRDANADGEMDGTQILGGAQDNGIKYRPNNSATVFNHLVCCDGFGSAIKPNNPNVLYYNSNDLFLKTTDGGPNGFFVSFCNFFAPIAIDYNFPDTVYLGGGTTRRSYNGFATAANLTVSTNTGRVLTTCPSNSARLYGSGTTDVLRSDDRAATWVTKSGTTGWPAGTFTINSIKTFPSNSLEVYVGMGGYSTGNKVMRSTNGGDSWSNWSGTLPNVPVHSLAVTVEGVYAGTEIGVYFRDYSMSDWIPFYNGLPRIAITDLWPNANGLLYASTFGRGIWTSPRRSTCSDFVTASGDKDGPWYYEANRAVTATITSSGSQGSEIFLQGGDSILLKPGFHVKAGSYLLGYIAPCKTGGIPVAGKNGATYFIPHLSEVKPQVQQPLQPQNYYQVTDERLFFNVIEKSRLQIQTLQADGSFTDIYPDDIIYPGLYVLPKPQGDVRVLLNGSVIQRK
jgi:hypothetical protein